MTEIEMQKLKFLPHLYSANMPTEEAHASDFICLSQLLHRTCQQIPGRSCGEHTARLTSLLIGFSMELALKAFILVKNYSCLWCLTRYPYGHNLENLLNLAEEKGLTSYNKSKELIRYLNRYYKNAGWRYGTEKRDKTNLSKLLSDFLDVQKIPALIAVIDKINDQTKKIAQRLPRKKTTFKFPKVTK